MLGALDIYAFGLSRHQTAHFARRNINTGIEERFTEYDEHPPHDLNLLLKNLESLVNEPRHLGMTHSL